jgi:hypothetical protein
MSCAMTDVCRCRDCEEFMRHAQINDAFKFWYFISAIRRGAGVDLDYWWSRVSHHLSRWNPQTLNA